MSNAIPNLIAYLNSQALNLESGPIRHLPQVQEHVAEVREWIQALAQHVDRAPDVKVLAQGTPVASVLGPAPVIEAYVRYVASESGQRVDWSYVQAARDAKAVIRAHGNIALVVKALEEAKLTFL